MNRLSSRGTETDDFNNGRAWCTCRGWYFCLYGYSSTSTSRRCRMIRNPNFSPSTVGAPKLECHLASFRYGHTLSHGLRNGVLRFHAFCQSFRTLWLSVPFSIPLSCLCGLTSSAPGPVVLFFFFSFFSFSLLISLSMFWYEIENWLFLLFNLPTPSQLDLLLSLS